MRTTTVLQETNSTTTSSLERRIGPVLYVEPSLSLNQEIAKIITKLNHYRRLPPHPHCHVQARRLYRQDMLRRRLTELEREKQRRQDCFCENYYLLYYLLVPPPNPAKDHDHDHLDYYQETLPTAEIDYNRLTSFLAFNDDSFLTPWNYDNPSTTTTTSYGDDDDDDDIIEKDQGGSELSSTSTTEDMFRVII